MVIRRPTTFTLGAHTHKIVWMDGLVPGKTKNAPLMGQAHRMAGVVEISRGPQLSPMQQGSTAIHEALHMALYDSPVCHFAGWNDEVEEAIIATLEGPLLELFTRRENRKFRDWLASLVH